MLPSNLFPKSGKFMASITILSLLLPSSLVLFFSCFYESLNNHVHNVIDAYYGPDSGLYQQMILYLALQTVVEIAMLIAYFFISRTSGIATVLVSAMSCTDEKLSLQDLFRRIKSTWKRHLSSSFRKPKNPIRYPLVAMMVALYVAVSYINLITIVIAAVFVISVTVFQLYSSAAWALYHVISVVEDVEDGAEALEKAEELVKGRRHHGFMINLLFNLVFLVVFLGGWVMFGDEGLVKNLTVYGLLFVNSASLGGICWSIAYTVLYFECKKQRGEEIDVLGNFQYTKLASEKQGGDAT